MKKEVRKNNFEITSSFKYEREKDKCEKLLNHPEQR